MDPLRTDVLRRSSDRRGSLRWDAGIAVLHLEGTDLEMARQHGELLAEEIREGALPFMAGFLSAQVRNGSGVLARLASRAKGRALEALCRRVARNAPADLRAAFHAMARTAGLDPVAADVALGAPDALLALLAWVDRPRWRPPRRGCPSWTSPTRRPATRGSSPGPAPFRAAPPSRGSSTACGTPRRRARPNPRWWATSCATT